MIPSHQPQNALLPQNIVITGAAGLVGQNLVPRLWHHGFRNLTAIDKHKTNTAILKGCHPHIRVIEADLACDSGWQEELTDCGVLIIGHAQIGGIRPEEFIRNNIQATERLLETAREQGVPYIVHISSSVVNSIAVDCYTETKKSQEAMVTAC